VLCAHDFPCSIIRVHLQDRDSYFGVRPNDNTHSSASALVAQKLIPGSELHRLPITDQDVPLIPFPEWSAYEEEIARVFVDFMQRALAQEKTAA